MRLASVLVCLPLSGCFQVDLTSGRYACDRDDDCPTGLLCRDTAQGLRCVTPGDADLRTGDDVPPPPDLRKDDGDGGQNPLSPCAGEGRELAAGVWACRGNFNPGGAAGLCRDSTYHVCTRSDAPVLASWPACGQMIGFYAADVTIERVNEQEGAFEIDCDPGGTVNLPWGLLGCGREPGNATLPARVVAGMCPPLPTVLRCDRSDAWNCQNGTLSRTGHSRAETQGGGVLCCKNR